MPGPPIPQPSSGLNEVLRRLGINLPSPQSPQEQAAMRSGGVGQGIRDIGNFVKGLVTGPNMSGPVDATDLGGVLSLLGPAVLGKIVYHGSPFRFRPEPGAPYGKFDPTKVGSGEGAAAFGYGMPYLSDAPVVARNYTKNPTGPWYHGEQMLEPGTPPADAAELLWGQQGNKAAVIDDLRAEQWEGARAIEQALRDLDPAQLQLGGPVYRVDLPDDQIALMLDWDARMKDQPANVQRIANEYFGPHLRTRPIGRNPNLDTNLVDVMWRGGSIGAFPEAQVPEILANVAPHVPLTGQGFYESVGSEAIRTGTRADMAGAMKAASEWLRSRGVPGLKYYDAASRGGRGQVQQINGKWFVSGHSMPYANEAAARVAADADVTRNYVMFDPNIPKIVGIEK